MAEGRPRDSRHPAHRILTLPWLLVLALLLAGCMPATQTKTPTIKIPSKVVTEEGMEYSVYGLKLPGTFQEFKLRGGKTLTWLPLSDIGVIFFTGPETAGYRPVNVTLASGERLQGDLYVHQIIEGTTDLGYWNIPLNDVKQIGFGME